MRAQAQNRANMPAMPNIYVRHGYDSRQDYLNDLADQFGLDAYIVFSLAGMLGETEDFDGLISSLEDYSMIEEEW